MLMSPSPVNSLLTDWRECPMNPPREQSQMLGSRCHITNPLKHSHLHEPSDIFLYIMPMQFQHPYQFSISLKKYFGLSFENLFFQISEFSTWRNFPNPYGCWWWEPRLLTTQKVALLPPCLRLKSKPCPWLGQLLMFFLQHEKDTFGTLSFLGYFCS